MPVEKKKYGSVRMVYEAVILSEAKNPLMKRSYAPPQRFLALLNMKILYEI